MFCCHPSNISIVCFKQFSHFTFKLRPIITSKYLGIVKHATVLIDRLQHKQNFAWFFGLKGSGDFISWCNINACHDILVRVFFKDIMRLIKQIKLMLFIRFCHIVIRMMYLLWKRYMNMSKCLLCYSWLDIFSRYRRDFMLLFYCLVTCPKSIGLIVCLI